MLHGILEREIPCSGGCGTSVRLVPAFSLQREYFCLDCQQPDEVTAVWRDLKHNTFALVFHPVAGVNGRALILDRNVLDWRWSETVPRGFIMTKWGATSERIRSEWRAIYERKRDEMPALSSPMPEGPLSLHKLAKDWQDSICPYCGADSQELKSGQDDEGNWIYQCKECRNLMTENEIATPNSLKEAVDILNGDASTDELRPEHKRALLRAFELLEEETLMYWGSNYAAQAQVFDTRRTLIFERRMAATRRAS